MVPTHETLTLSLASSAGDRGANEIPSLWHLDTLDMGGRNRHWMSIGARSETHARDAEALVVSLSLARGSVTLRLLGSVVVWLLAGLDPFLRAIGV